MYFLGSIGLLLACLVFCFLFKYSGGEELYTHLAYSVDVRLETATEDLTDQVDSLLASS